MIFCVSCIVLLILCTFSILPSFLRIGIDTDAQESPILSCSDGSVPDAITGLCADGFAPQSNLSELPSTVPDSAVLAGDNVTDISNITASQLLNENEVVSGEINSSAPAPEEIQMDTNGDGVVDETESQNQPAITGNAVPSEEIQMDTNGDGVVDETESQNQPAITGNAVPSEEIQMDTNGDGVVDETESQNTAGSNAGVQGSGGPRSQTQCEGDLAVEFPLARKTLDLADQNAKDFVRLLQAGGGIKQFPSTKSILVREVIFWHHLFGTSRLEECRASCHGCSLHSDLFWTLQGRHG